MQTTVLIADYQNTTHATDIGRLLAHYAQDPMGGGKPLPDEITQSVAQALARIPHAFSVLCYVDGQPAGLVNGFEAFSTFQCKPLINVHDVVVAEAFRGMGLSQLLLTKVEEVARARGCCKLTLEVLEGNQQAQHAYRKFGFMGYELDPQVGKALFWQKPL
ncbi:MAG: GNAT family N-acetyltransferase [Candidatus Thiothrix putei]|uniref:GNAT family N-acetyltransferase n=1 Tax=Candidatus Thiothrix putei TaxID=3080811 RepID=A0AA95KGK9_9GAMM|nr:MAG: GNAT family N-acetyltransferase [Candidatus Thiothrix putei]